MTPTTTTSSQRFHSAELFVGADWAIAHGDAGGLSQVAADLAAYVTPALQRELLALEALCHVNYEQAAARWPQLRALARAELCERVRAGQLTY